MSKQITKKVVKNTVPKLSKKITDEKEHNFVIYACLKDNISMSSFKNMVCFTKAKDKRISSIKIISIDDVTKKDYKNRTVSVLLKCNAQQYIIFKKYLFDLSKKYLIGQLEATQKDIEKYNMNV